MLALRGGEIEIAHVLDGTLVKYLFKKNAEWRYAVVDIHD
jgi:hypothetical protein